MSRTLAVGEREVRVERIDFGSRYRLWSDDYVSLKESRTARLDRIAWAPTGFPLAVMHVEPVVRTGGSLYQLVVLGSRHLPDDVLHVYKWPLSVNVAGLVPQGSSMAVLQHPEDLAFFAIGQVEPLGNKAS
jgi:hypothetical protein